MDYRMPSFPVLINSRNMLKLISIEWVMPSNHLILCCSLFLSPSVFPSIRVLSIESVLCIRWPKNWSFSFRVGVSPSNEYSGLISFRIDWFDLLAVQGTLKSLLWHCRSKASILWPWKPVPCMCFPCAPTYLPVKQHVSDTWVGDELHFNFLN